VTWTMLTLRLRYQARYYWRVFCHLIGFCPKCGERVMTTRNGTVFCPTCGGR